jgi:hypothetical protein
MPSAIATLKELARQDATGDFKFLKKFIYYFELRVPPELGIGDVNTFFYPLIINPQSITMDEPFSVSETPTQIGGLYVEEGGIIRRPMTIRGTTGFKPRKLIYGWMASGLLYETPEQKSHSRVLPNVILEDLSGHAHFKYLQDTIFRIYADLKKNPTTAKDTMLFFHNPKDDEHWRVIPKNFNTERTSESPVTYQYTINMIAVEGADDADKDFSEDKGLLDEIKDAVAKVNAAVAIVKGAINDVQALVGEIKGFIDDIATTITNVIGIVDAVVDFAEGVTDLIEAPFAAIEQVSDAIDSAGARLDDLKNLKIDTGELFEDADGNSASVLPEPVLQSLSQIGDGMDLLGMYPALFETPAQATLRKNKERQETATNVSQADLETAAANPPATLQEVGNIGTSPMPGDLDRADSQTTAGRTVRQYTSVRSVPIAKGDTLVSLAARYLGDARLWQDIAVHNGLKPPFIDDQASAPLLGSDGSAELGQLEEEALPGTLGPGKNILIPNFQRPPERQTILPVLGVKTDEPAENQFLGTDFKIVKVSRNQYDIAIDTDRGSIDAQAVSGIENLKQGMLIRLITERGTDVLYKRLGLKRVVALNFIPVDLDTAKFRISEAVITDPRIASVRSVNLIQLQGTSDQLEIDVEAEVRGFAERPSISVIT